jgi:ribosomal protein S14
MRVKRIREVKDYKIRYSNFKNEPKFTVLRAVIRNSYLRPEFRIFGRYLLYKFSLEAKFPNNFQNRCLVTGRVRATIPYFKLSRIEFRRLAKQNRLMGVKKSSWLIYCNII